MKPFLPTPSSEALRHQSKWGNPQHFLTKAMLCLLFNAVEASLLFPTTTSCCCAMQGGEAAG